MHIPQKYNDIREIAQKALKSGDHSEIDNIPLEDKKIALSYLLPDRNSPYYKFLEQKTIEHEEREHAKREREEGIHEEKEREEKKKERKFLKIPNSWIKGFIYLVLIPLFVLWFYNKFIAGQIDPNKIRLCLVYAYEHKYRGSTHKDEVKEIVKNEPINIILDSDKKARLFFGIWNKNKISLKGLQLLIEFPEGIKVDLQEYYIGRIKITDWQVLQPNKKIRSLPVVMITHSNDPLLPGKRFLPLILKFSKNISDKIEISYTITAQDIKSFTRSFKINLPK
ncbi:MAG: hypothetical protein Q6356_005040 [Candidatus Wukongarchaeota archaeon]|nr:hypothetical protein [Candidatus Wukongarchaeota archaeon]